MEVGNPEATGTSRLPEELGVLIYEFGNTGHRSSPIKIRANVHPRSPWLLYERSLILGHALEITAL
jgi:hypothetical protein